MKEISNIKQGEKNKIGKRIFLNLEIKDEKKIQEFLFIKKKIKDEKVKKGEMKIYTPLKNTDVVRWCLEFISKSFKVLNIKNFEELRKIKRSLLKDKMRLFSED